MQVQVRWHTLLLQLCNIFGSEVQTSIVHSRLRPGSKRGEHLLLHTFMLLLQHSIYNVCRHHQQMHYITFTYPACNTVHLTQRIHLPAESNTAQNMHQVFALNETTELPQL